MVQTTFCVITARLRDGKSGMSKRPRLVDAPAPADHDPAGHDAQDAAGLVSPNRLPVGARLTAPEQGRKGRWGSIPTYQIFLLISRVSALGAQNKWARQAHAGRTSSCRSKRSPVRRKAR